MINDIKAGKFISLVLRHRPEAAGITLDGGGWADVNELIKGVAARYKSFTMDDLERIVRENDKQRYSFNEDKTKIRANQGHSLKNVDIGFEEMEPPAILYHGTAERSLESIMAEGIKPMSRQYVHLSKDNDTAVKVGKRHGAPAVLFINTEKMYADGYKFYLSENGVWLTEKVPPEYIERSMITV